MKRVLCGVITVRAALCCACRLLLSPKASLKCVTLHSLCASVAEAGPQPVCGGRQSSSVMCEIQTEACSENEADVREVPLLRLC